MIVPHRVPAKSGMSLVRLPYSGRHTKIHRTTVVLSAMPLLLLEHWQEQYPEMHEQTSLVFSVKKRRPQRIPLFELEAKPGFAGRYAPSTFLDAVPLGLATASLRLFQRA